jgi:hypothetical protein
MGTAVRGQQVLKELNIPFDEIYFSKPKADFYIDDRAVFSGLDLAKELGYYDLRSATSSA